MMTLEAWTALTYRRWIWLIVVDIDGVNITELINKAAENGYSLRVVDDRDSTQIAATYASLRMSRRNRMQ